VHRSSANIGLEFKLQLADFSRCMSNLKVEL
jgi:hypothetical protein